MEIGQSIVSTEELFRLKEIQTKYLESKEGIYVSEEVTGKFPHSEMSIYKSVRYIGHIEALKMLDDHIKALVTKQQDIKSAHQVEMAAHGFRIKALETSLENVRNATLRQRFAYLFKREIPGTSE